MNEQKIRRLEAELNVLEEDLQFAKNGDEWNIINNEMNEIEDQILEELKK